MDTECLCAVFLFILPLEMKLDFMLPTKLKWTKAGNLKRDLIGCLYRSLLGFLKLMWQLCRELLYTFFILGILHYRFRNNLLIIKSVISKVNLLMLSSWSGILLSPLEAQSLNLLPALPAVKCWLGGLYWGQGFSIFKYFPDVFYG